MPDTRYTLRPFSDCPRKQLVPTLDFLGIESVLHTFIATVDAWKWEGCQPYAPATGRPADRPDHDQQHCYHHARTVKPEATTVVVELLMMAVRTTETC